MHFQNASAARLAVFLFALLSFFAVLATGLSMRGVAKEPSKAEAVKAFDKVATVMRHPRCMNCHQDNIPLQGDERRLHIPHVVRGEDNLGATAMRCTNCHHDTNTVASGVPGAPHWSLAPLSMKWQGLSTAQLCRALTNKARNGGRSLEKLTEHMGSDPLVLWGWTPGGDREPVSIQHDEFMEYFRLWTAAGAPCPG